MSISVGICSLQIQAFKQQPRRARFPDNAGNLLSRPQPSFGGDQRITQRADLAFNSAGFETVRATSSRTAVRYCLRRR